MFSPQDIAVLVEGHVGIVYAAAKRFGRLRRDEDLLQCGMLGLLRAARAWDGVRDFAPFALVCVRREMLRHVKREEGRTAREHCVADARGSSSKGDGMGELLEKIRAGVPQGRRRLVLMALAKGWTAREVGQRLGIPPHEVVRLARRAWGQVEHRSGNAD